MSLRVGVGLLFGSHLRDGGRNGVLVSDRRQGLHRRHRRQNPSRLKAAES